jgi:NADH:ubiquinone oxidoreductase subunit E
MAPVMIVNEKYFGTAKAAKVSKYLDEGGADEN